MTSVIDTSLLSPLALHEHVARRRTFAIISHPDAGKTTLTEKLLLYAGAVDLAGSVRARANQRRATSDWMEMEQQRGISVTSTALQFDYEGYRFNLLDTPGHQDFSEDTYRTLMAVDSAVMVLDAAKGIEPQTKKLFEVCRLRRIPIVTFINKLDHPSESPLFLLDQIEHVLSIGPVAMNWPIGDGPSFQGVYDLRGQQVLRFERTARGQHRAPVHVGAISDPALAHLIGDIAYRQLCDEVELLAAAGTAFDRGRFLTGDVTPVFFGSALNNFGVQPFLDALCELAPSPGPRMTDQGPVAPDDADFSGFIFKIQANMDPRHRDSMAFLRVCSGRFEKDMVVWHPRLGRSVRMSRPHRLFARERETVEEAYPGDVIGLVNPGLFAIGDTLCTGQPRRFDAIPRFPPEHFAIIESRDVARYKQFHKGLAQLEEEGAIQVLTAPESARREPILAAVGELQFDVVAARLRAEYGVETTLRRLPYTTARWVEGDPAAVAGARWLTRGVLRAQDRQGRPVALFQSAWDLDYAIQHNPAIRFRELG
ncbi:MAG: peptide chain release factor 3 [Dehalococcoidia bacterium]